MKTNTQEKLPTMGELPKEKISYKGQEVTVKSLLADGLEDVVLVYESVLKRLANNLKNTDFYTIKSNLKTKISETNSVEELVALLDSEVKFHKTVNLITKVNVVPTPEYDDGPNYNRDEVL